MLDAEAAAAPPELPVGTWNKFEAALVHPGNKGVKEVRAGRGNARAGEGGKGGGGSVLIVCRGRGGEGHQGGACGGEWKGDGRTERRWGGAPRRAGNWSPGSGWVGDGAACHANAAVPTFLRSVNGALPQHS